jgi:uridine phosphorylase
LRIVLIHLTERKCGALHGFGYSFSVCESGKGSISSSIIKDAVLGRHITVRECQYLADEMAMEFPEEDYAEPPLITPTRQVLQQAETLDLAVENLKVPKHILLSLSVGVTPLLIKETKAKEAKWIYRARPLYIGEISGKPVGIIWACPGAPLVVRVMEDLIACGAKVFVGVGLLGAIQPYIDVGDCIIPSLSVRDEGTSHHYLPRNVKATSSKDVSQALRKMCRKANEKHHIGPVWTTDAPYRETKSKISYFRKKKVLGVDMECSAIFSLAIYRKVKAGCIMVASCNLVQQEESLGFFAEKLKGSLIEAIMIAKGAISTFQ